MGRFDEAQREFRRAYELDLLSLPMNVDWGRCLFNARRYDDAIEHLLKTVEMDGSFARAHGELALAYMQKGMFHEAVMSSLKVRTLHGAAPEDVAAAQKAFESGGISEYRRFELDRLLKQSEQEYVPPYNFVSLYISLDEKDKALEWLEKSLQVRDDGPPSLRTDPRLDPLRSDPRFAEMLRRTGLL
jgi:tetratricopeptide (TPR) repeat protein